MVTSNYPIKPTCDQMGNRPSKHYQSNAMEGEIKSEKLLNHYPTSLFLKNRHEAIKQD
jgi:hypothetical protein